MKQHGKAERRQRALERLQRQMKGMAPSREFQQRIDQMREAGMTEKEIEKEHQAYWERKARDLANLERKVVNLV